MTHHYYLLHTGDRDEWEKGIESISFETLEGLSKYIENMYSGKEETLKRDISNGEILIVRGDILPLSVQEPEALQTRLRFSEVLET